MILTDVNRTKIKKLKKSEKGKPLKQIQLNNSSLTDPPPPADL